MITLYNSANGAIIGEISEAQLKFLFKELEEESLIDTDYYLSVDTLDMLEADGADPALVALLRRALDEHGEVEIRWERR
jgi:processive 1,2-diacylglycerol beta-glucosyltransferase